MNSTIAAISTPLTAGAIGIVRLSGPEAKRIAGEVFRPIGPPPDRHGARLFGHLRPCLPERRGH